MKREREDKYGRSIPSLTDMGMDKTKKHAAASEGASILEFDARKQRAVDYLVGEDHRHFGLLDTWSVGEWYWWQEW